MEKNIYKVDYTDEMEQSYIDYAMSVIVQRAIPDIRDGLKPVHRRILYSMKELNLDPSNPYKKSARIIGDVLGKYHPHGDSSVYEAMVRLAQDFNTNHPLVKGQGNFGSIDGDPAAAMRYTEAKLEPLAMHLLNGLNKDTISFQNNFDNSLKEPEVLPARFFNLLVNGSTGIAVGMSTNIPPHNLREVNKATIAYLKNENINNSDLLKYIKGPDFPTGGVVINKSDLLSIYTKGNGRIRLRGVFDQESLPEGRNNLIIKEIPYTLSGNKTGLIEDLIQLVNERKLDEVVDIRDESSQFETRIVLEIKRGVDLNNLQNKLFHITRLEDTVTVNLLAIVNGKPSVLSLKDMIKTYCDFLMEVYRNEIIFDLNNLKHSQEINQGLIDAYNIIDLIIEIIRGGKKRDDVINCLIGTSCDNIEFKTAKSKNLAKNLSFSKLQAESIMKMQLQRLVGMEVDKIKDELKITVKNISFKENLLGNDLHLRDFIIDELNLISKKFARPRLTKITNLSEDDHIFEEKIIIEDLYALIDKFNYLKVIDEQSFSRTNDETLKSHKIIPIKSNDRLCLFTNDLLVHQIKIEDLKISKMADRGKPLPSNLEIFEAQPLSEILNKEFLFTTKLGYVKRVIGKEFETNRRELISTRLRKNDELIDVSIINESDTEVILTTKLKRQIRFDLKEVSKQKRIASGVIGINLNVDDYVISVQLDEQTTEEKRRRGSKGYIIK